jgi:chorismate dehydratase
LLIGDPALRLDIACAPGARRDASGALIAPASLAGLNESGSVYIYDIVEKWRAMTNLPAVLAVWAARRDAVTPQLVQDFQESLAFGLQHVDAIASEAAADMKLPAGELRRYLLESIDYHLDEENLQGLTRYYILAASLGLIPEKIRTVEIAPQPGGPVRYMDFVVANRPGLRS